MSYFYTQIINYEKEKLRKQSYLQLHQIGKEAACNAGDLNLIPGLVRYPGEGNGNPLQYSCLQKPMDRGAWQATVYGLAKSQT